MARHYNLIIFQSKNSENPELGPKVAHRMVLDAKFRLKICRVFFRFDLKNAQV